MRAGRIAALAFLASCGGGGETFQLVLGADTTPDSSGTGYTYNSGPQAGHHFSGCMSDCFAELLETPTHCAGPAPFGADGLAHFSDGSVVSKADVSQGMGEPQALVCNLEQPTGGGCSSPFYIPNETPPK
jgi:hypothetical protein